MTASTSSNTNGRLQQQQHPQREFPFKLYALLEDADANGFSHIVSWQKGGKSFRVHKSKVFVEEILRTCFNQTKYKSFLRQLNIYDFHRIQHGPNKGGYVHEFLARGKPELCHSIVRVFVPTKRNKRARTTQQQQQQPRGTVSSVATGPSEKQHQTGVTSFSESLTSSMTTSLMTECAPIPIDSMTTASPTGNDGDMMLWNAYGEDFPVGAASSSSSGQTSKDMFAGKEFFPTAVGGWVENPTSESTAANYNNNNNNGSMVSHSLKCTAAEVDFFTDLFQPSLLEEDVPILKAGGSNNGADGGNHVHDVVYDEVHHREKNDAASTFFDPLVELQPPSRVSPSSSVEESSSSVSSPNIEESMQMLASSSSAHNSSSSTPKDLAYLGFSENDLAPSFEMKAELSANKSLIDWPITNVPSSTSGAVPATTPVAVAGPLVSSPQPKPEPQQNDDLGRSEAVFPAKLHRMLQDAPREGFSHIVSWIQGGTAFKVHNIDEFKSRVMNTYFSQSKYASFRRQLNMYGFTRVNTAVHGTYYFHKSFLQKDTNLLRQIVRPKTPRSSSSKR